MTRTDVMASSRPRGTAAPTSTGRTVRRRHGLLLVPVLLAMALALVVPGVAAAAGESTSGYSQKPEEPKPGTTTPSEPKTTTTTPTEPKTGTSPSKEEKASEPSSKSTEPASTGTSPAKASTLPFTGLDLRWTVAIGLLLIAGGFSVMLAQRRTRSGSS